MSSADGHIIIDTELDESGLRKGLSSISSKLVGGISAAVAAAGTALSGLGAYAISVGSDFEQASSNLAATMGTTTDKITELTDKAKELGASTSFSATEAAEGLNILAQAGLTADEQLQSIDATLNLAAAGEMAMDSAAGYLTTTIKAFSVSNQEANISMADSAKIADIYAKGATLANTSTSMFAEAMNTAASLAGSYNQSINTTGTALLALADKGYTGAQAGNYLGRAMADLYTPTSNAADALEELGVKTYDSAGNQRDFVDIVNDMNKAMAGMTEEEKSAYTNTIFTTVGLKAFNSIAGTSTERLEELSDGLATASDTESGLGSAADMAATKLDNLQGDITILKSATEGFGISVYENMQNPLRELVQEGTGLMDELNEAVTEGGLSGLASAVGTVLAEAVEIVAGYIPQLVDMAVSLVNSFLDGLIQNIDSISGIAVDIGVKLVEGIASVSIKLIEAGAVLLKSLVEGVSSAIPELLALIPQMYNSLALLITQLVPELISVAVSAVVSLVDAIQQELPAILVSIAEYAQAILDQLPVIAETIIGALPDIIQSICDIIVECLPILLEAVSGIIMSIAEQLPTLALTILEVLPDIINTLVDTIITLLPMIIDCVVELVNQLVAELPNIINQIVMALPQIIHGIVQGLLKLLPQIVDCGVKLFTSLVQALPQIIYAIVAVLPTIIASIIETLVSLIPLIIQCGIELLTSLISALPQIIVTIVAVLPQIIASIVSALLDNLPLLIQCGIDLLTSLIKDMPTVIATIIMALPKIISSIVSTLIDNIPLIISAGAQLLSSLVKAIPQCLTALKGALPQIVNAIVSGLKAGINQVKTVGSNIVTGLWNGISGKVSWLTGKIKGFCSSALGAIKSFFGIKSPSTVMRDIVGKNLMLGWGKGIENNADAVTTSFAEVGQELLDTELNYDASTFEPQDITASATVKYLEEVVGDEKSRESTIRGSRIDNITISSSGNNDDNSGTQDSNKPKYVEVVDQIDGKTFARKVVPYVEKELEWRK